MRSSRGGDRGRDRRCAARDRALLAERGSLVVGELLGRRELARQSFVAAISALDAARIEMAATDRLIGWLANPSAAPNSEGASGEPRPLRNYQAAKLRPVELGGEEVPWPSLVEALLADAAPRR